MSMNEYELSLVKDAKKGKRKALKQLIESYHDHLVGIVERELHSRDQAEKIIKYVKKKAKIETMLLRDPMGFEQMIEKLTIAECANYSRGSDHNFQPVTPDYSGRGNERPQMPMDRWKQDAYRPAGAPQRPGSAYPSMQNRTPEAVRSGSAAPNNAPSAAPFRPAAQNNAPAAPFRPAAQNNAPAAPFRPAAQNNAPAAPFRPAAQNNAPAAPFRPAAQNNAANVSPFRPVTQNNGVAAPADRAVQNREWHANNRFEQSDTIPGVKPAHRAPEPNRNRASANPIEFRSVNMGNATPRVNVPPTPVQNTPQQSNDRNGQDLSRPIQQNPWRAPLQQVEDNSKTELLVEEPKADTPIPPDDSFRGDAKTELLTEEPKAEEKAASDNQTGDAKTTLLTEEPKAEEKTAPDNQTGDAKTTLLTEEPKAEEKTASDNQSGEAKTTLLTEEPKAEEKSSPDIQSGEAKTELLTEELKTELPQEEPKTELLAEHPDKTPFVEPKTELLPEAKTERMPQPQTDPAPEPKTVPDGELLFKPDQDQHPAAAKAPEPPVHLNAPKVGLLVCVKGENAGENFSLYAGRNRVGVSGYCDVQIKDASLTEDYNFEIIYDEKRESFSLLPGKLSSRLFVNDNYVDSAVFIQSHDTLRTGNSAFLLVSFQ